MREIDEAIKFLEGATRWLDGRPKRANKTALAALRFVQWRSQFWSKDSNEQAKFQEFKKG